MNSLSTNERKLTKNKNKRKKENCPLLAVENFLFVTQQSFNLLAPNMSTGSKNSQRLVYVFRVHKTLRSPCPALVPTSQLYLHKALLRHMLPLPGDDVSQGSRTAFTVHCDRNNGLCLAENYGLHTHT